MIKKITVRGIHEHEAERSQSIRNYIEQKDISKLQKLLEHTKEPVTFEVTVDIHKTHPHHECLVRVYAPHFEVIVKKENTEAYKAIDEALDQTFRQLAKHKEEQVDKRKK